MTPAESFKLWRPDTLVPSHEEAFEAGWKACMDFMEGRTVRAIEDPRKGNPLAVEWVNPVTAEISQPTAEDIYNAYPRKVGKQAALRAITKAISLCRGVRVTPESYTILQQYMKSGDLVTPERYLLAKTQAYAAAVSRWTPAQRYTKDGIDCVPHPATWFNRGSYDDPPSEWQRGTPTTQQIRSQN